MAENTTPKVIRAEKAFAPTTDPTKAKGHIIQADWAQEDASKMDYIHNKPTNLATSEELSNLSTEIYDVINNSVMSDEEFASFVENDLVGQKTDDGGEIFNDYDNNTAKSYAHAEGYSTKAEGSQSHTEGDSTKAYGKYSHAEGSSTTAGKESNIDDSEVGVASHAEGAHTLATGFASHAEGYWTQSLAESSHAEGYSTKALSDQSHAEGNNTTAAGAGAHAEGSSSRPLPEEYDIYDSDAILDDWISSSTKFSLAQGTGTHVEGENCLAFYDYSHAEGHETRTNNFAAHAEGQETAAEGEASHAEGYSTTASGQYSHAEGESTTASASAAHAEGSCTTAEGDYSHAEGQSTIASEFAAHAEGCDTYATGKRSHAEGSGTTAEGMYSHAEGEQTKALEEATHAEGWQTTAQGSHSHTEGDFTATSGSAAHAEGKSSRNAIAAEVDLTSNDSIVSAWTNSGKFSLAKGEASHVEGQDNLALGVYSHAEGIESNAEGTASHTEGGGTHAIGMASHAEGGYTTAYGNYSHSEGNSSYLPESIDLDDIESIKTNWINGPRFSLAKGTASHVEGEANLALGDYSHAEGYQNVAEGYGAHVEGYQNSINGAQHAHAEGDGNTVTEQAHYAHIEGTSGIVGGAAAHVEGGGCAAFGLASHAEGDRTIAFDEASHAEGNSSKAFSELQVYLINLDPNFSSDSAAEFIQNLTAEGWVGWKGSANNCLVAKGLGTHAEGTDTLAIAEQAHAEGLETVADGIAAHAEGYHTRAAAKYSHAEGQNTSIGLHGYYIDNISNTSNIIALNSVQVRPSPMDNYNGRLDLNCNYEVGDSLVVNLGTFGESTYTIKTINGCNIEFNEQLPTYTFQVQNQFSTQFEYSVYCPAKPGIGPVQFSDLDDCVNSHAEGLSTLADGEAAHAEGYRTTASGEASHAEGGSTQATNNCAHAEGSGTRASGHSAHAEGGNTKATNTYAHAEGNNTTAAGVGSHAEGRETNATGTVSHAEGYYTTAYKYAHAEGYHTAAYDYAHTEGYYTYALAHQHAQGHYNKTEHLEAGTTTGTTGTAFVIGNGLTAARSNAFRIDYNGKAYAGAASGAYNSGGADYAEYFEWIDENLENEDRRGYFVTTDGENIKIAKPGDYILGIVSGQPAIVGNSDEDWMGRYVRDEFGAAIKEDFEYEEKVIDEETKEEKTVIKIGTRYKENPDYDPTKPYIQRENRPEWSAVGMMGVLSVRDDGTCQVNGYCQVAEGGIATAAETGYRVIKRVNDHIIKVIFR